MFKKEETKKVKNSLLITHPNALPTTRGQRAADKLTKIAGSWGFIIGFLIFLVLWMMVNVIWLEHQSWDPYPFILLNLVLSSLAAFQAPIILMSQNRENERDRQRAEYDYAVNRKAEREIEEIKKSVERIERKTK
ncbi:MAG TPA: DUF1003 domain-containing protein [Nanoarchaeota archaeon]|nr:DUF1003 domain-containing protein [Nanoarchaeota archaeon]